MHWIIETTQGSFEGNNLKQTINDMIEYYGSKNEWSDQIEFIMSYNKHGREKILPKKLISKIQDVIDEGIEEWYKDDVEEWEHLRQLRSDYYASIL